ncbi:PepSY domain-containing protein [Qipengyuania spongiae]|uniref:PepSY domain-containing protein n=1 Tax=Qipengyuania spongiae TaxID=2909673 RepID=A0ABY5T070_9SPHN|nr:PepSY domain-containing protein [Qipengyuania spongiae]UVI40193.1 PepSY domain-containing protein [Qipengyuania spongiae]
MATPSLKLRLHVLGSKIHKWLAIFVGVQVLLWMGTGALMSFLNLEEVRSEHVVSREQEALPADAPLPAWVANDGTLAAVSTRSLDGDAVTEVRKVDGSVSLHEPVGTEFRGPFPAWQVTYADEASTRLYIDASSGTLGAARSDTWRLFDFIWGLHIMDWTERDRINSWWLLLFGIGGTIIALSGFVLLANRMPRLRRRTKKSKLA